MGSSRRRILPGLAIVAGFAIVGFVGAVAWASDGERQEARVRGGHPLADRPPRDRGVIVDTPSMSESELAAQPEGQSGPGAGGTTAETSRETDNRQSQPRGVAVYHNSTYGFKVSYPANFALRSVAGMRLGKLRPRPAAAFRILNPTSASSKNAGLEPADLEIRVHPVKHGIALRAWLKSNQLSGRTKPFQTAHVSGIEVCATTMIAPGCSYFVLGRNWIYQLTPASIAGEKIARAFVIDPHA